MAKFKLGTAVLGWSFMFGFIVILAVLATFPTMWVVNYLFAPSALMAVFGVTKFTLFKAFAFNVFAAWTFKSTNSTKESK